MHRPASIRLHVSTERREIRALEITVCDFKLGCPPLRDSLRVHRARVSHAIAHILGILDEKFELNRRMSEPLEV